MKNMAYILYWFALGWKFISSTFYLKWITRNFSGDINVSCNSLKGKTAIVTGGNSGIGFAISMALASRGCRVIIACRRDAREQKKSIIKSTGNDEIITKRMDLSKLKSVRQFAQDIIDTEEKIDILVNNAGIGASTMCSTEDGLNTVMQVNYFGHVLLTYLLVDKLKASDSARVMFMSSMLANTHNLTLENLNTTDFNMNAENVTAHYSNSKVCNILAAQEMSKEMINYGIMINSVDPGIARTPIFASTKGVEMDRRWSLKFGLECLIFFFGADEHSAAKTVLHLAAENEIETGSHYFRCRPFVKPGTLNEYEFCEEIWKKTKQLIKVE